MRIGSLFSGYGGLDLAVAAHYGATVAWHVEFDKHPSAILAHHYPDIPNYGDVTAVDWSAVEPVDIVTGGFPCQDVSHAGLRRGVHQGTRSGLWFEMARAIDALQPRKVVIENVAGLLSADAAGNVEPCPWCVGDEPDGHMRALGAVLADLAEMGFDAEWGSVRAADAGAPHGRLRVFIVATARNTAGARRAGAEDAGTDRCDAGAHGGGSAEPQRGRDAATDAVGERLQGREPSAGHGWQRGSNAGVGALAADEGRAAGDEARLTLLPTPKASDGPNGGPGMRNGRGVADALPGVVSQLLPTPAVNDMGRGKTPEDWDEWTAAMQQRHGNGNEHGKSLEIEAQRHADFGPYAAAVARWEAVIGRPAPSPTEPGSNGRPRLSPRFVEWMMGLPEGWVTGVGIPRSAQLKALGNGVVPQQAALALALTDAYLDGEQ